MFDFPSFEKFGAHVWLQLRAGLVPFSNNY